MSVRGQASVVPSWAGGSYLAGACLALVTGGLLATAPVAGAIAAVAGVGGMLAQWLARRRSQKRLKELGRAYEADAKGLRVAGELVVETSQLSGGNVLPNPHGATVTLQRSGWLRKDLQLQVGSVEEGRALIDALGVGVRGRVMIRKVTSLLFSKKGYLAAFAPLPIGIATGVLLSLLGLRDIGLAVGFAGVPWLLLSFYTIGLVKTRITIGADGVQVAWLGRERLIALSEIDRVEARRGFLGSRLVTLHLRSGEVCDITVAMRGRNVFEPFNADQEQELLRGRIAEALRLGESVKMATLDTWMQDLSELPVVDWIRELRLHVRAGMRDKAEDLVPGLLRLAERTSAAPAMRAAAAVALGPVLDEAARDRLNAAAQSTAAPRLRVALEAAAEDREADLVEVFSELSAEHRATVRVAMEAELMAEAEQEVEMLLAEDAAPYRSRGH